MFRWIAVAVLLFLAGCGGSGPEPVAESPQTSAPSESPSEDSPTDESPSQEASPKPPAKPGTRITVRLSAHGPMLFSGRGQAVYLWEPETTKKPRCYDDCAGFWPPVLTDGEPVASGPARDDLLGTTRRTTGDVQVTYAGNPLYYFANDGAGQVTGHGIDAFGGMFLAVTPAGKAAPN